MMVDEPTKIWAAGFFDGEGGLSMQRNRTTFELFVTIGNTVKEAVELFHNCWGGYFHLSNKAGEHKSTKNCWQVIFRGDDAYKIILDLLPYIKVKGEQFELAKEYFEKVRDLRSLRSGNRMTGIEQQYCKEVLKMLKRLNDGEGLQDISIPILDTIIIPKLF